MAAFHRLRIDRRYRLDGTARLVLYHLCWRHNSKTDTAWPSTREMARDLDLNRSVVIAAIRRLEALRLLRAEPGGGRGRSTRYRICFVPAHLVDPTSKQPIDWHFKGSGGPDRINKQSGGPDRLEGETVRWSDVNGPVEPSKTVRPTGPEKNKTIKSPPGVVQGHAGGQAARTADDVFRELHSQRQLSLMSVASEKARRPAVDNNEVSEPAQDAEPTKRTAREPTG
jgi:hypothetical protein